jgi:hypothetical protein
MARYILAIAAVLAVTLASGAAFACNYDTQVTVGAIPTCFDVFGGCGELTLESACTAAVTFEEVSCSACGATRTLQNGDIINYPLALPEAIEGAQTTQAFRWESEGTQAFIDVTTTYTTTGDVACAASTAGSRAPLGGGFVALVLLGLAVVARRARD